jgi:hypothetical protein
MVHLKEVDVLTDYQAPHGIFGAMCPVDNNICN